MSFVAVSFDRLVEVQWILKKANGEKQIEIPSQAKHWIKQKSNEPGIVLAQPITLTNSLS